jgi:predicted phage terminase large subunit-like protein
MLLIEAPPRHGKSELVSKYLPAWYLGLRPGHRVMLAAYEATFARSWGRKARQIFAEHSAPLFGASLATDNQAADDWSTTQGGGMTTAGVGGPMTGRGANLLIIDDPIKNAEDALSETIRDNQWDWWQSTASTRLEPGGVTIGIMTRWHEDDIFGRLMKSGIPIRRLRLPAIAEHEDTLGRAPGDPLWPERYDRAALDKLRAGRSGYWWDAMFQQKPGKWGDSRWGEYLGDKIWAARWPDAFEAGIVAVDPSLGKDDRKGDFSAIVFVGLSGGKLWVDADLRRRPTTEIARDSVSMALRNRAEWVSLETNGFQQVLAPQFNQAAYDAGAALRVIELVNRVGKEIRIERLEPLLAAGQFVFKDTPGCRLLVDQLGAFPRGDHDDGPDALEMAVRGLNERAHMAFEDADEQHYAEV